MVPPPASLILGCEGERLTAAEKELFASVNPMGFILFNRNCTDPGQLRALVGELRACVHRPDAPVLIDQEGGRVARLGPPNWPAFAAAAVFGALAADDQARSVAAMRLHAELIGWHLATAGITVDCAPVLDLLFDTPSSVIGDRAFGAHSKIVAALGASFCAGLMSRGVLPVIKHLPGHGRARVDSHKGLPRVDATLDALRASDFAPFRALCHMPLGMTAHIAFDAIDPERPATQSKIVIENIIRGEIGFDGLLLSDDISMAALSGPIDERALRSWDAGCDVVLHCNGIWAEMAALGAVAPPLSPQAVARWERAMAVVKSAGRSAVPMTQDAEGLATRLATLME